MCKCHKRCNCHSNNNHYGCPVRLGAHCVTYQGTDLPRTTIRKGDNFNDILVKLESVFSSLDTSTGGGGSTTSLTYNASTRGLTSVYSDGSSRTVILPSFEGQNITLQTDSSDITLVSSTLTINKATATTDGLLSKEDKARLDGLTNSNPQTLTLVDRTLSISGGNSVTLPETSTGGGSSLPTNAVAGDELYFDGTDWVKRTEVFFEGEFTTATTLTLPSQPLGRVEFIADGIYRSLGATKDYTISGTTLTMNFTPISGGNFVIKYKRA